MVTATLIFPPPGDPSLPPLGISTLAGFLRTHGHSVSLLDLNIRAYNELLSAEGLGACRPELERKLAAYESKEEISATEGDEYKELAGSVLSAEFLIRSVDIAREALRDRATYASYREYQRVTDILARAMSFISAAHYPTRWSRGGLTMSIGANGPEVMAAATDSAGNIFHQVLARAVTEVVGEMPPVIGISVNYYPQLVVAMTLASLFKKAAPRSVIVIGGGLIGFYDRRWAALAPLRQHVDAWVPFEGEYPLLELINAVVQHRPLDSIEGVLTFDGDQPRYRPPQPAPRRPPEVDPSFDGLPLRDYLAPEPILPVLLSRGCYWGRCAFCSHHYLYRQRFSVPTASQAVGMLRRLSARYGSACFYICDECVPPRIAFGISEAISSGGDNITWMGEVRFEASFTRAQLEKLRRGGCRLLSFGLESGSDRVLSIMNKGTTTALAARILNDAAGVGLRTHVMLFFGFPTEALEEAESTVSFVERHAASITQVGFSAFGLEEHSPVYRNAERYGVTNIRHSCGEELRIRCDYEVRDGLTQADAEKFARNFAGRAGEMLHRLAARTHLVFLPHKDAPEPAGETAHDPAVWQIPSTVPVWAPWLVPRQLAFNLAEIGANTSQSEANRRRCNIKSRPTQYVMRADTDVLLELSPPAFRFLRACDSRFNLAELLALAKEKRAIVERLVVELGKAKFICAGTRRPKDTPVGTAAEPFYPGDVRRCAT